MRNATTTFDYFSRNAVTSRQGQLARVSSTVSVRLLSTFMHVGLYLSWSFLRLSVIALIAHVT